MYWASLNDSAPHRMQIRTYDAKWYWYWYHESTVDIRKECSFTSLSLGWYNGSYTYDVNNPNTTHYGPEVTRGDNYCPYNCSFSMYDGDTNGNGEQDDDEFTMLPITNNGVNYTDMFRFISINDRRFYPNVNRPVTNADSTQTYILKYYCYIDTT